MTRKLYLLLVGAVVSGALVAACGGGSSPTTTTTTTSSASTTSTTSTATTTSSTTSSKAPTRTTTSTSSTRRTSSTTSSSHATTPSSGIPAIPPGGGPALVAICKAEIQKLSTTALTADEKAQLNHLCDIAGSGNAAQIRAAEKQICLTVIKDSAAGFLSGSALKAAQQSCSKVGQTPAA
jgi:hypothetical protein